MKSLYQKRSSPIRSVLLHLLSLLLAFGCSPLQAAIITVTSTADDGPGTLRASINQAAPGDTIDFGFSGTVLLTSTELTLFKSVTIIGGSTVTISRDGAAPNFRIFNVVSGTSVILDGLTISNGRAPEGAGILNLGDLTIINCRIEGNIAAGGNGGGGILNQSFLTMIDSTLENNQSDFAGGGISNNLGIGDGPDATLSRCAILNNSAPEAGGIHNQSLGLPAIITLVNCTVSGNTSTIVGGGGSNVASGGNAAMSLVNCTFADNLGPGGNCIITAVNSGSATVSYQNSIFKGLDYPNINPAYGGAVVSSLGHNISSDDSGLLINSGDQPSTDPGLGTLDFHGGLTRSYSLLSSSPAIDAGSSSGAPTVDQRGVGRPIDGNTDANPQYDIGSFEAPVNTLPTISAVSNSNPTIDEDTSTGTITFTIGDNETPLANLVLSASSSNPALVPNANLLLGGTGSARSITITPNANQNGSATITITLADDQGGSTTTTITLSVNPVDDATFTVTNTSAAGPGSLRQAILDANAEIGFETINFSIAGVGPHIINCAIALPQITDPVFIDGYSQPGSAPNTLPNSNDAIIAIVINGQGGDFASGIDIAADSTTVRGLGIWNFQNAGIFINGHSINIQGCFIGTSLAGGTSLPNQTGITLVNGSAAIGGTAPADRNVISGNTGAGIQLLNEGGFSTVQGNFIGTSVLGTGANPNSDGIAIIGSNATIGGLGAGAGNTISGNNGAGISVTTAAATGATILGNRIGSDPTGTLAIGNADFGITVFETPGVVIGTDFPTGGNIITANDLGIRLDSADNHNVRGNFIGTDVTGTLSLGNLSHGIYIINSSQNTIGGSAAGEANTIAFNAGAGVYVSSGTGNRILGNSFSSNGGLGIDLEPAGVTGNDGGDLDAGPNNLQNFPVIDTAQLAGGQLSIAYSLPHESPGAYPYTVHFYLADPTALEGKTLIHTDTFTLTDLGTTKTILFTPAAAPNVSSVVVATATDGANNTSEFSAAAAVNLPPTLTSINTFAGAQEDTGFTITYANLLGASDAADPDGDAISGFVITSVDSGTLTIGGTPVVPGNTLFSSLTPSPLVWTPAPNVSGPALQAFSVVVSDNHLTSTPAVQVLVDVTGINDAPTIIPPGDHATSEDTPTIPLGITLGDAESDPATLLLTATSSNQGLVPDSNIVLGGSGANRTISLTPTANLSGTTTISLNVSDGILSTPAQFVLTVNAVNDQPTIAPLGNVSTAEDVPPASIPYVISDTEDPTDQLTLTGSSSNQDLLPDANISIINSGATQLINLTPVADQSGTALVTITVTDTGASSQSTTFQLTVTAVDDTLFTVTNINDSGPGSLRAAILNANADTGIETIQFNIAGAPPFLITPSTPLPAISETVTIDAYSQPGATMNSSATAFDGQIIVHIIGSASPGSPGLEISADNVSVLGLCIKDFSSAPGIVINNPGTQITGCIIGGSNDIGIEVNSDANAIGGSTPALRNVLSGNSTAGIKVLGTGNSIQGNLIGTDKTGASGQANAGPGIYVVGAGNTIGGGVAGSGNVISGNSDCGILLLSGPNTIKGNLIGLTASLGLPLANFGSGIRIDAGDGVVIGGDRGSDSNIIGANNGDGITILGGNSHLIRGNFIGTDPSGSTDLGNLGAGIAITSSSNNTIGGLGALDGNWIYFNGVTMTGVALHSGTGNSILGNSMKLNIGLGIDLGDDGVTSNDAGDPDSGPNNGQNSPDITAAIYDPVTGTAAITYQIDTITAHSAFPLRVEFFLADPGTDEGMTFVGADTYGVADESKPRTATVAIPSPGTTTRIVATATDAASNTSEFATAALVNSIPFLSSVTTLAGAIEDSPFSITFAALEAAADESDADAPIATFKIESIDSGTLTLGGVPATPGTLFHITSPALVWTPPTDTFGSAIPAFSIRAYDGVNESAAAPVRVDVAAVNDSPTISAIANQSTNEDVPLLNIPFTVADVESDPALLILTASSTEPGVLPVANITFGGSLGSRTISIVPVANKSTNATITVAVQDPDGGSSSISFSVAVLPVNDNPTLTDVTDQTILEDGTTGPLAFTVDDLETAAGLLTLSATSSDTILVPNPNIVLGGTGPARTVTVTPAPNQFGTATITLTLLDGTGGSASDTFLLTVQPVNDPPQISDVTDQTTNEDTPTAALAFTVDDLETPAASLTVVGTSSNQALVPDANIVLGGAGLNRTVLITPAPDQFGSALITLTVTDAATATSLDTFLLTVLPVNDAPTITPIADTSTPEDTSTPAIPVVIGDAETAPAALTLTATSSNTTLVPNANILLAGSGANRTVTLTPAINQSGSTTITITVGDAQGLLNSDTFVLTVNAVNDPPVISDIVDITTNEDTPTTGLAFTISDTESPTALLTVSASSDNQTLVPDANLALAGTGGSRSITATPALNQSGTALISVTVSDPSGGTAVDTFLLTVLPVNDNPSISDIANLSTSEDIPTAALGFTISDTETPAAALIVTASSSDLSLVPNANIVLGGAGASRTVTVTPAPNQAGTAIIQIDVTDASGGVGTDTFVLSILPVNDSPTLSAIAGQTVPEDSATGPIPFTVGDVESAAGTITVTAVSSNTLLVPNASILLGGAGANRTVTITPTADAFGSTTITLTGTDPGGATGTSAFLLTVTPINDLPTISVVPGQGIAEDTTTPALPFTVSDVETAAGALSVTATSSNPTLVPNPAITLGGSLGNRTISIAPAPDQFGSTTITLTVTDIDGGQATSAFLLTVTPVEDAPTISNIADLTLPEDTSSGPLSFTVSDAETAAASLAISATTDAPTLFGPGSLTFGGSGGSRSLTILPAPDASGSGTITVTVTDGAGLTASDSFIVTVQPLNDPPTLAAPGPITLNEDTPSGALPVTIADVESAPATLILTASSSDQSVLPNAGITLGGTGSSRTVLLTPAPNSSGTSLVTLTVTDPAGSSTTASFSLTVLPINDPPALSAIAPLTIPDTAPQGVAFSITDPDSAIASITLSATSSTPAVLPDNRISITGTGSSRLLVIDPVLRQTGTVTITLTATDGSATGSVTILATIIHINNPPQISDLPTITRTEDADPFTQTFSVSDLDPQDTVSVSVLSLSPSLIPDSGLELTGAGASRSLRVVPLPNAFGTATLRILATDGADTTTRDLSVLITPVNDIPSIVAPSTVLLDEDTSSDAVPFELNDIETDASGLTVTAISDNTSLVPPGGITLSGNGTSRSLRLTPTPNQAGSARITLTVVDPAGAAASSILTVVVAPVNDAPEISELPPQTIDEDFSTEPLPFVVSDLETPASQLVVEVVSDNPALLPPGSLIISGTGSQRNVRIVPAPNGSGSAEVTLIVRDGSLATSTRFTLTVRPTPDVATISTIPNQVTVENSATLPIPFVVRDALSLRVTSSNPALIPEENFIFSGQGNERTVIIVPSLGRTGSSTIELTAVGPDADATTRFQVTVNQVAPEISLNPVSLTVNSGQSAQLNVAARGSGPLRYQWRRNGTDLPGAIEPTLNFPTATTADAGDYTVLVSNTQGEDESSPATLSVLEAPGILQQPASQSARLGQRVVLTIAPAGAGPFTFQWRKNGNNLPGSTEPTLILENVQPETSGRYSCVVASPFGASNSDDAVVTVLVDPLVLGDAFADRRPLTGDSGSVQADNTRATREAGEPIHAGRSGGKSVWFTYTASATGILTIDTIGSSFDTLLALYTGSSVGSLVPVIADDDGGGFLTSRVQVRLTPGSTIHGAVDGVAGASGTILLSHQFEPTPIVLPVVTEQPGDVTATPGTLATFRVAATTTTGNLVYRWLFNGSLIQGAIESTLTIPVGPESVGAYQAQIGNGSAIVFSRAASLQINISETPGAFTEDKFFQAIELGGGQQAGLKSRGGGRPSGGLASGYTGTQIFNSYGSGTEVGEPNHCGAIGGASQWFSYRAERSGKLTISTEGSDFDTVLAVYTSSGQSLDTLQDVACDNDSGADRRTSIVRFDAVEGTIYFIAVDGVNGTTGNVRLSYELVPPALPTLSRGPGGQLQLGFSTPPGRPILIQTSPDLVNWVSLLLTNPVTGTVQFLDPAATNFTRRYYRAIPAPANP